MTHLFSKQESNTDDGMVIRLKRHGEDHRHDSKVDLRSRPTPVLEPVVLKSGARTEQKNVTPAPVQVPAHGEKVDLRIRWAEKNASEVKEKAQTTPIPKAPEVVAASVTAPALAPPRKSSFDFGKFFVKSIAFPKSLVQRMMRGLYASARILFTASKKTMGVARPIVVKAGAMTGVRVAKMSPVAKAISCALALGMLGGTGLFWLTRESAPTATVPAVVAQPVSTGSTSAPTAVEEITRRIGRLMPLPVGEEPTLATVSDITVLKDQPFFRNAKNGDFVLMYAKAKRAILYDAIGDRILEVAPIVETP
jgi:hypothetical protein